MRLLAAAGVIVSYGCGQPPGPSAPYDLGGLPEIQRLVRERIGCSLERRPTHAKDEDPWDCTMWLGPCNCSIHIEAWAKPPVGSDQYDARPKRTDDLRVIMLDGTVQACPDDSSHLERILGLLMARVPPTDWRELRDFATTIQGGMPAEAFDHDQTTSIGRLGVEAVWRRFAPSSTSGDLDHSVSIWLPDPAGKPITNNITGDAPPRLAPCHGSL